MDRGGRRHRRLGGVRRGDFVTAVAPGTYGKPRPMLVFQADEFGDLTSVTVLPLTSHLHAWPSLRVSLEPDAENGLREPSQIMIDKAVTLPVAKIGRPIGTASAATLMLVDVTLARFLALA